jgi:hypothetical protein
MCELVERTTLKGLEFDLLRTTGIICFRSTTDSAE